MCDFRISLKGAWSYYITQETSGVSRTPEIGLVSPLDREEKKEKNKEKNKKGAASSSFFLVVGDDSD